MDREDTIKAYAAAASIGFLSGSMLWLVWQLFADSSTPDEPYHAAVLLVIAAGVGMLVACGSLFLWSRRILRIERAHREPMSIIPAE